VVELDEIRWFVSFPLNFLVYAVSATIDGPVLPSEDGSNSSLVLDIPREPWDLWNENNNLDQR